MPSGTDDADEADETTDAERAQAAADAIDAVGVDRLTELVVEAWEQTDWQAVDDDAESDE
jgi:hypothetical protein